MACILGLIGCHAQPASQAQRLSAASQALARYNTPAEFIALQDFYAARIYSQRQPLTPPYKLIKPVDTSRWASCPAASRRTPGLRDVAFISWDSPEDNKIYLGLDIDSANMGKEILYTGLTDKRSLKSDGYYIWAQPPLSPLAIKTSTTSAEIFHHARSSDTQPVDAKLQTSKVEYAALRADADHDGLPDVVEKQLRLDPANPDMDGDGLLDGADSLPNLDQGKFGPVERGVQRAMVCDLLLREDHDGDETQVPWSAEYFTAGGCAPVAISYTAAGFGVYVDPATWPRTGPGYCEIGVVDLSRDAASPENPPFPIFPAKYWRKLKSTPKETDLVVTLDWNLGGDVVFLVEIQGEYFPLEAREHWVT